MISTTKVCEVRAAREWGPEIDTQPPQMPRVRYAYDYILYIKIGEFLSWKLRIFISILNLDAHRKPNPFTELIYFH